MVRSLHSLQAPVDSTGRVADEIGVDPAYVTGHILTITSNNVLPL
jgi:hypothetical protein